MTQIIIFRILNKMNTNGILQNCKSRNDIKNMSSLFSPKNLSDL